MSYDSSHGKPPRQERWPQATPPDGWPSYRDGDTPRDERQADGRYAADRQVAYPATAGHQRQVGYQGASGGPGDGGYQSAVATDTFPPARNGYGSAVGYGQADGYGDARDGFDWTENGYGGNGGNGNGGNGAGNANGNSWSDAGNGNGTGAFPSGGYAGGINGYARAADDFAEAANGYGGPSSGYAGTTGGYPTAVDGYADAGDSFAGGPDPFSRLEGGYGQATDEYVSDASGYDWSENGYGSAAEGYGSAADGYVGYADGYGGAGGYGSAADGYAGAAGGYGSAADGYAGAAGGYGSAADGYAGAAGGYGSAADGYARAAGGYGSAADGYARATGGYGSAADGYAGAADGFAGSAGYLGPGSYTEPGLSDPMLVAPDAGVDPDRWQADQDLRREVRQRGLVVGAVTGLLAAAVAIGVSTLAAGFAGRQASPMSALGSVFIDRTPTALKNAAVQHFGTHGRTVLLLGMYAAIAVLAVGIGVLARYAAAPGVAGLAAFSLIAAFVAITRPGGHVGDVVPAIIGGIAGVAALLWLRQASAPTPGLRPTRGNSRRRA